jgi:hypothetical protein
MQKHATALKTYTHIPRGTLNVGLHTHKHIHTHKHYINTYKSYQACKSTLLLDLLLHLRLRISGCVVDATHTHTWQGKGGRQAARLCGLT